MEHQKHILILPRMPDYGIGVLDSIISAFVQKEFRLTDKKWENLSQYDLRDFARKQFDEKKSGGKSGAAGLQVYCILYRYKQARSRPGKNSPHSEDCALNIPARLRDIEQQNCSWEYALRFMDDGESKRHILEAVSGTNKVPIEFNYDELIQLWTEVLGQAPEDIWHFCHLLQPEVQRQWYEEYGYWRGCVKFHNIDCDEDSVSAVLEGKKLIKLLEKILPGREDRASCFLNIYDIERSVEIALHLIQGYTNILNDVKLIICQRSRKENENSDADGNKAARSRGPMPNLDISIAREHDLIQKFVNTKRDDQKLSGEELEKGEELSFYRDQDNAVPIMIYGASGTGKSKTIRKVYSAQNCMCIEVSCASFDGSHKRAKEDLFGTNGSNNNNSNNEKNEGKYIRAQKNSGGKKKGCLVLNDVDLLDRRTQVLLLEKLNSPDKNSSPVPQIICTTKCPKDELRKKLLPELFAFLCQREITFQGLKRGEAIWDAFVKLWKDKNFGEHRSIFEEDMQNKQIWNWNDILRRWMLEDARLFPGNWWDLNRYAIQYNDFLCGQLPGKESDGTGKKILNGNRTLEDLLKKWEADEADARCGNMISGSLGEELKDELDAEIAELKRVYCRMARREARTDKEAAKLLGVSMPTYIDWRDGKGKGK